MWELPLRGIVVFCCLGVALPKQERTAGERCFCELSGEVDDCSCKVENINTLNNNRIYPILQSLLNRDYFRFFKVNLRKDCPFWEDDGSCTLRDCHINTCTQEDLPSGLKGTNKYSKESQKREDCEEVKVLSALDTTLSDESREAFKNWTKHDDSQATFCELDDEDSADMEYVDLLLNPERYTGYKGRSPHRIWHSVYNENCFQPEPVTYGSQYHAKSQAGLCLEKRVFYRMVSGLHSSINIHLSARYLFPDPNGYGTGTWGRNVGEFQGRFDPETTNDNGPQWLKNLFFAYLVELRAIAKAAPYLEQEQYFTGNDEEDVELRTGVLEFLNVIKKFPHHFDEGELFKDNKQETLKLKEEFRSHFWNISRIMDCVGCDKCRLWGKLQIQGMGTALKILFAGEDMGPASTVNAKHKNSFQLRRTEIVSLFNAFGRLSTSIRELEEFRLLLR